MDGDQTETHFERQIQICNTSYSPARAGEDHKKSDLDQRSRSHMRSRSKIKMTQDHLIDLDHRQDQRSRS